MKRIKIDEFEYHLNKTERVIGILTESKNLYTIILKPQSKLAQAVYKKR